MYNAVFHKVVVSGITQKTDEELMYDVPGAGTTAKTKMYGRPTKHQIAHPEEWL
jgi:hypothetical protein